MSDAKILHPVPEDEISGFVTNLTTALVRSTTPESNEIRAANLRRLWSGLRTWGAVDGGRVVATLNSEPRSISIPGPGGRNTSVEADAVTRVSVAATHRRRGLLRAMLTESLQEAHDRGDALSILIAAEWPLYGRYGYGPANDNARFSVFPRRRLATVPAASAVRSIDEAEVADVADQVYELQR